MRNKQTFCDKSELWRKALHMVGLLLQKRVGDELREVGVLHAQLLELPVKVALHSGNTADMPSSQFTPAQDLLSESVLLKMQNFLGVMHASSGITHLHILPQSVSIGADDHGAPYRAVVGHLGIPHHIQVPPAPQAHGMSARHQL